MSKRTSLFGLLVVAGAVAAGQSAATVSVGELRHPAPSDVENTVRHAFDASSPSAGTKEMKRLKEDLNNPRLAPYALKAMGAYHLDAQMLPAALTELSEAARLLPWDSQAQAMYGYSLYRSRYTESAMEAIERALNLDRSEPVANLVKGLQVLDKIGGIPNSPAELERELADRIHVAARAYPGAHLILWLHYANSDQPALAAREMRDYRRMERDLPADRREVVERWIAGESTREVAANR